MSFAMKKIPVLFFFSGMHSDYHSPTDTADKINFWGMEQVIRLSDRVVQMLVAAPREQYVASFDSRSMAKMGSNLSGSGGGGGHNASLGVIPDYSGESSVPGSKISGTMDGTAAEKAGLKAGDIIVHFGEMQIDNLQDLSDALAKAKPGDKVRLTILRDGKQVEIDAVLGERKG